MEFTTHGIGYDPYRGGVYHRCYSDSHGRASVVIGIPTDVIPTGGPKGPCPGLLYLHSDLRSGVVAKGRCLGPVPETGESRRGSRPAELGCRSEVTAGVEGWDNGSLSRGSVPEK